MLPNVSVVIVFFDEHWSILLRTIHSVYNRTPHELLHEIILVNDNSTIIELYEPLKSYVKKNFDGLVWMHILNERRGLTIGKLEGARMAKGEVLVTMKAFRIFHPPSTAFPQVFLDSQVEVNVNWLPPLLGEIFIFYLKRFLIK